VAFAGLLLLAARPLLRLPPGTSLALLVVAYGAILAASLAVAAPAGPSRLAPWTCLAAGMTAVVVAAVAAGPAAPIAWTRAALPVGILAAIAEEALLRRVAYSRLERFGAPIAVALTAALFALVHVPAYGFAALPVDLGAGLLLSWQRWASGTWTVPAATHAFANAVVILA
jgi:membrane protease YdiL (CAAX protease family)